MATLLTLADRSFATREHAMLRRLEVGFANEGWRVLHAAPQTIALAGGTSLAHVVEYDPDSPFATAHWRASRLIDRIDELGLPEMPDIIHAWGNTSWGLSLQVADQLGIPAVLEVWADRLVPTIKRWERRITKLPGIGPLMWTTPSSQLLRQIDHSGARFPSRLIHWGVYAAASPRRVTREGQRALAVLSTGHEPEITCQVIEAIATMRKDVPRMLVLLDEAAVAHHHRQVWSTVRETGMMECTTIVADMESRRDIVLQADVLLQPEATGEVRSITLDALSHGIIVLARRDNAVDTLVGDGPAIVIDDPSQRGWEQALSVALNDHHREERRAIAGQDFASQRRQVSTHVEQLLDVYQGLQANIRLSE